ncbi:MAG: Glu/Leu/Phe/Val dehydrogenase dimerization domain-containing protein [Woeseiaceae bacterium]|nr:Glu/Leu/Phe/Val dehydrogenase dimerization domain-containing protein [Woeseiaceae bacterium]
MSVFDNVAFDDHERVVFCRDRPTGLSTIIAIHSTVLGPAAGGARQWAYGSEDDALYDVLRLSQGMSYKNAMAGLRFGGGKAVIIKGEDFVASDALYEAFGDFVEGLNGAYITAEDVGMSPEIMQTIASRTRHVTGLPTSGGKAGGDPSPKTAFGIFRGIEAAVRFRLERDDLRGTSVAVQGVGNVGYHLCRLLSEAGATLIVADLDAAKVQRVVDEFGATAAPLEDILYADVDVVAPCALGAILTAESIPKLRTRIVAGGANNQLETREDGQRLADAGILYAPDYVINGGGIINVACEYEGNVGDAEVMELVAEIGPRLSGIFEESAKTGRLTNDIADEQARRIIEDARGAASAPT